MINPYTCYAFAFAVALALYPLGWSGLYPPISYYLLSFVFITIFIHVCAGILFKKTEVAKFRKLPAPSSRQLPLLITGCIYLLWCAEFIYAGGIPLVEILLKHSFDYKLFGIPTVHVFIVTFSSFYTIFLFHQYISSSSRRILIMYLVNLAAALLIYNRGMFLFNLSATIFLFLIYKPQLSMRHIAFGVVGGIVLAFFFGVMGSLRVSNESRVPYTNDGFLHTGQATQSFRASSVPKEFFWAYVYTTSPLANLQVNMNASQRQVLETSSFLKWFNNEVLLDFISKRINALSGDERLTIKTVPGPFNATTVYAGSFSYLGFTGLVLMSIVVLLIPYLYTKVLGADSPFFLVGLTILNTIFLFMIFDNTIRFTGLSFQMVYPIVFHYGSKWLPGLRNLFL